MSAVKSSNGRALAILLTVAAAVWAVLRVGINTIPDLPQAAATAALWPQEHLADTSSFIRNSPIGQILYRVIGSSGPREFLILHVVAGIAALVLWIAWVSRSVPTQQRTRAARLALLTPLLALIVSFFGSYDPFTVLGFGALLFAWTMQSRVFLIIAGCYLGFQHFEQSCVAVVALMLAAAALSSSLPRKFESWRKLFWALGGIFIGKLVLSGVLYSTVGNSVFGRDAYGTSSWLHIGLVSGTNFLPIFVYSLFASSWALVLSIFLEVNRRAKFQLVLSFLVCLVPAYLAIDHTRVFVLTSAPAIALLIVATIWKLHDQPAIRLTLVEVIAWVCVPVIFWTGMDGRPYLQHTGWIDLFIMFGQQWNGFPVN